MTESESPLTLLNRILKSVSEMDKKGKIKNIFQVQNYIRELAEILKDNIKKNG